MKNRQKEPIEERLIREGKIKESRRRQRLHREEQIARINSRGNRAKDFKRKKRKNQSVGEFKESEIVMNQRGRVCFTT